MNRLGWPVVRRKASPAATDRCSTSVLLWASRKTALNSVSDPNPLACAIVLIV
jgi:hypothetical protein